MKEDSRRKAALAVCFMCLRSRSTPAIRLTHASARGHMKQSFAKNAVFRSLAAAAAAAAARLRASGHMKQPVQQQTNQSKAESQQIAAKLLY